ncbi:hypothetical protein [Streptomyces sp. NPDC004682]
MKTFAKAVAGAVLTAGVVVVPLSTQAAAAPLSAASTPVASAYRTLPAQNHDHWRNDDYRHGRYYSNGRDCRRYDDWRRHCDHRNGWDRYDNYRDCFPRWRR